MRRFLCLVFLLVSANFYAQVLKIEIKDSKSGDPIQNVTIAATFTFKDSVVSEEKKSNGKGIAIFLQLSEGFITFTHPIYQNFKKNISSINISKLDTLKLLIFLQPIRQRELKEVKLSAPGKVDTVFGSENLSVLDFELLKNGNLLLLLYPKNREKAFDLIHYDGLNIIDRVTSDFPIKELERDYLGNIHAIGEELVNGIDIREGKINLAQIPLLYYIKYLAPIIDTTITKAYVSNFNALYPAFEYYTMDRKDSTYTLLTNVKDELMMTLYRSEYKWVDVRTKLWAKEKELNTGIDAEIWVGANFFTQSIYWEEVYAPLFERNDSVFVINYPKDQLEIFDSNGTNLKKIPIYHHYQRSKTGFKRKLIQDYITGAIYALYEKAGKSYLGLINVETGDITETVKLNFKYIDQIKVYNNEAFYIYRPFESVQKRYLYKERLPYTFKSAKVNHGTEISIDTGR